MAGYLGNVPTAVPLSSADLQDNIITSAKIANGAITGDDINSTFNLTGKTVTLPAGVGGKVLQVVSTTKTDIFTRTDNTSFADVTGVNVTITPSSASNKIFVSFYTNTGSSTNGTPTFIYYKLQRKIGAGAFADVTGAIGDSRGSSIRAWTGGGPRQGTNANITADATVAFYLDSPATTSTVVYQVQIRSTDGTATVGGSESTSDANRVSTPTVITAMEIAG